LFDFRRSALDIRAMALQTSICSACSSANPGYFKVVGNFSGEDSVRQRGIAAKAAAFCEIPKETVERSKVGR